MYHYVLNFFAYLFSHKYFVYFLNYCILQNIITIALLPLYGSWGISFSSLSLIGNFIFSPLLIMYLIFSIIILIGFCFQKWFLFIINMQKYLIDFWVYVLCKLTIYIPYGIFTFINDPYVSYPLCWGLAILFIFNQTIKNNTYYFFIFTTMGLLLALIILSSIPMKNNFCIVEDFNKVYVMKILNNSQVYLHNISMRKSIISEKKIEYLFLPEIKKNFGVTNPLILYI